jgi:hypothetical protein
MRGDAASRSSYYQSGIQNGWLTRNEARIAENLNPLEGLDHPLRPLNMAEEGVAEDVEVNGESADNQTDESVEPDAETNRRIRAMVFANATRLARRICRAGALGDSDLALIAEALAVPLTRVTQWAQAEREKPHSETELTESLISLGTPL